MLTFVGNKNQQTNITLKKKKKRKNASRKIRMKAPVMVFRIFNKRKSPNDSNVVNNIRVLATNNNDTSIFEFLEIQFTLIILKNLKQVK